MKQTNKPSSVSESGRIGLVTLNACLKQLLAEGVTWSADAIGPDGRLVVRIPSFNIVTGEDGKRRIVEAGKGAE